MTSPDAPTWLIFDTHPIQYRSPVFKALASVLPRTEAVYFSDRFEGNRWWFHEVNKIPKQPFGVPLQEGFANRVLRSQSLWGKARELWQLFRANPPRGALLYGYYLPEHWLVWVIARWHRVPLVFIGENYAVAEPSRTLRGAAKSFFRKLFLSQIARFVSIGDRNRRFYRNLGIADERIDSAKYCIDNRFFQTDESSRATARLSIRAQLGVAETDLLLLFVGRLFDRKRPLDLVLLKKKLAASPVQIVVVGNGEMETSLRQDSADLKGFHVLGFKSQVQIREYYWAADILLVTSEYETWGLVTNEAFAGGMTAAVTDTCGTAGDLVVSGETGLVFPVGNMDVLADLIRQLRAHPDQLKRLKQNASRKVNDEYTPSRFADTIKASFLKLGGSRGD